MRALILLCLAQFVAVLDGTVVLVALPAIGHDLSLSGGALQWVVTAYVLASVGGLIGVAAGWGMAGLISAASPLPAKVTAWSVALALSLGAGVGVLFGVYPASRAAQLDPIAALRQE